MKLFVPTFKFFGGKSITVAFGATCQNNTKSLSFHKSSYQAHVGNNTLKKRRNAQDVQAIRLSEARDESASVDEESGRYEPGNV